MSILGLKQLLEKRIGVSANQMRLIVAGETITEENDHRMVKSYEIIKDRATVLILFRLPRGIGIWITFNINFVPGSIVTVYTCSLVHATHATCHTIVPTLSMCCYGSIQI